MSPPSTSAPLPAALAARIATGVPVEAAADRLLDRVGAAHRGWTGLTDQERAALRRLAAVAEAVTRLHGALRGAGREPIADRLVWTTGSLLVLSYLSRRERPGEDPYAVGRASVDGAGVSFADEADGLRVDEAWPWWRRLGAT